MKEGIILNVPIGSVVRKVGGSYETLTGIPEDALDRIEKGATYLRLNEDAISSLKKLPKERLLKILEIRKIQKIESDISILEIVLSEKESSKKEKTDVS